MSKAARRKNRVLKDRTQNVRRYYIQQCLNEISHFVFAYLGKPLPKMPLKIEQLEKHLQENVGETV